MLILLHGGRSNVTGRGSPCVEQVLRALLIPRISVVTSDHQVTT